MTLAKEYFPLVFFKGNIADLPKSQNLIRNSLFAYIILELLIWANITDPIEAFIDTFIECLLMFMFIAILLFYSKSLNLFIQTTTAFLICENIISLLAFPGVFLFDVFAEGYMFYMFIGYFVILAIWFLTVVVFLVKQLLPASNFGCFLVTLAYFTTTVLGPFAISVVFL